MALPKLDLRRNRDETFFARHVGYSRALCIRIRKSHPMRLRLGRSLVCLGKSLAYCFHPKARLFLGAIASKGSKARHVKVHGCFEAAQIPIALIRFPATIPSEG